MYFYFFFWPCLWHVEVPRPGIDPCHSSDLSCCSDNTESLTHCATRELPAQLLKVFSWNSILQV